MLSSTLSSNNKNMEQITSTHTNFIIILNMGYPLMPFRDLNNSNTRTIFGKVNTNSWENSPKVHFVSSSSYNTVSNAFMISKKNCNDMIYLPVENYGNIVVCVANIELLINNQTIDGILRHKNLLMNRNI